MAVTPRAASWPRGSTGPAGGDPLLIGHAQLSFLLIIVYLLISVAGYGGGLPMRLNGCVFFCAAFNFVQGLISFGVFGLDS